MALIGGEVDSNAEKANFYVELSDLYNTYENEVQISKSQMDQGYRQVPAAKYTQALDTLFEKYPNVPKKEDGAYMDVGISYFDKAVYTPSKAGVGAYTQGKGTDALEVMINNPIFQGMVGAATGGIGNLFLGAVQGDVAGMSPGGLLKLGYDITQFDSKDYTDTPNKNAESPYSDGQIGPMIGDTLVDSQPGWRWERNPSSTSGWSAVKDPVSEELGGGDSPATDTGSSGGGGLLGGSTSGGIGNTGNTPGDDAVAQSERPTEINNNQSALEQYWKDNPEELAEAVANNPEAFGIPSSPATENQAQDRWYSAGGFLLPPGVRPEGSRPAGPTISGDDFMGGFGGNSGQGQGEGQGSGGTPTYPVPQTDPLIPTPAPQEDLPLWAIPGANTGGLEQRPDYGPVDYGPELAPPTGEGGGLIRPMVLPAANSGQASWEQYVDRYSDPSYGGLLGEQTQRGLI